MEQMLTSLQNPLVRQIAGLKEKKGRDATNLFLVEGVRFLEEALQAEVHVMQVMYTQQILETPRGKQLIDKLNKMRVSIQQVSAKVLSFISDTETPQGIVAAVTMPKLTLEELTKVKPFLLIVDGVQDPGNLGTIVRTSLAAGAGAVICVKGTVDLYNPKTLRSTMGAIFKLPVVQGIAADRLADWLEQMGVPLVVADVAGEDIYAKACLVPPLALVIGSEAQGTGEVLMEKAVRRLRIPLQGGVESLNAAVAAALFLFESARQSSEKL